MRTILACACALLLLCSAARAERINLESVNAFSRLADDTLRVDVRFDAPFDHDFDQLRIWLTQYNPDATMRRLFMQFGDLGGTFDPVTQTAVVNYAMFDPGAGPLLESESVRRPVAFDGDSLAFSIARGDARFDDREWYARVQFIPDNEPIQNWEGLAHAPEPSALALVGAAAAMMLTHYFFRRAKHGRIDRQAICASGVVVESR